MYPDMKGIYYKEERKYFFKYISSIIPIYLYNYYKFLIIIYTSLLKNKHYLHTEPTVVVQIELCKLVRPT